MARKGRKKTSKKKGKKSKKPESKRSTSPKFEVKGRETDLFKSWTRFQEDLGEQLSETVDAQQSFYKDFSGNWLRVSNDFTEKMIDATKSSDKGISEIQDTWDKYLKKMNKRMEDLVDTETESLDVMAAKWKSLSDDMNNAVLDLASMKDPMKGQEKFINSWVGLSKEMTAQIMRSVEMGNTEMKDLRNTWSEMMAQMDDLVKSFQERSPEFTEASDLWRETSKKMNNDMLKFTDDSTVQITGLQSFWINSMTNMGTEFMKALWSMNTEWPGSRKK